MHLILCDSNLYHSVFAKNIERKKINQHYFLYTVLCLSYEAKYRKYQKQLLQIEQAISKSGRGVELWV